jgi:sigma-B regulation protein RsbU (phosphoserine phosphatase)
MRILIADDDDVSRLELEALLARHGHEVVAVGDGTQAWQILQGDDPPRLAVLDWLMDEMDGIDVCQRVRQTPGLSDVYLILLTSRGDQEHIVAGLQAGANDYVTKPFDREELLARVRVGDRMVGLQKELAARVRELEDALARVNQLQGLLPICSYCKRIRDDKNYWHQVETYFRTHSEAEFSHAICPACWESMVVPQFKKEGVQGPIEYPKLD